MSLEVGAQTTLSDTGDIVEEEKQLGTGLQKHVKLQFKLYRCECGKVFKVLDNFRRHQTLHKEAYLKAHSCDICMMPFNSEVSLRRHKQSHAGKEYHCPECNKSYANQTYLKAHFKKCHGKKNIILNPLTYE